MPAGQNQREPRPGGEAPFVIDCRRERRELLNAGQVCEVAFALGEIDHEAQVRRLLWLLVFVEPVGVDQARGIVGGVRLQRFEECGFVGHGQPSRSREPKARYR